MKLPSTAWIAPEKLTNYLLVYKKRNDKSEWLAQATLDARTIWMVEKTTGDAKFVTMYSDRKGRK